MDVNLDYVYNGTASGAVASMMANGGGMDPNLLRPWIGDDGRPYVTANEGGKPVARLAFNSNATLRKDEWKLLDQAIIEAAKPRLRAVADLMGAGLTFNIPNGMGKTVLETEAQSDITDAAISMDGLRESERDRPQYSLTNLPLPILHKDFNFSLRQIATSRNSGTPIDTTTAQLAGRRVAEGAEKLLLGTLGQYQFGGGTVYGYTNFPQRITETVLDWTDRNITGAQITANVIDMRQRSINAFHYGPWMLYVSTDFGVRLDEDYKAESDRTIRQRLEMLDGINGVRTLDYLPAKTVLLVQMTSDVVREVIGMNIQTIQWEQSGGMQQNYKVMAIMVPQLRADYNGNTGIVHGSVAT